MKNKNYYEILEISETASDAELKRAYFRLAKIYHPDVNPNTGNIFKYINEAYSVLSDPNKRALYDRKLHGEFDIEEEDYTYSAYDEYGDYYTNATYYQDPTKEPIVTILKHLNEYRIENAINAIWKRNIFVLLGNTFMCFIAWFWIAGNYFCKLFQNDPMQRYKKHGKSMWWDWLIDTVNTYAFFTTLMWWVLLSGIFIIKGITIIAKALYWCFDKVIRHFLIPLAIVLAGLTVAKAKKD